MAPLVQPDYSQAMTPNKAGIYVCQILGSEMKWGQQSGAPYINWKLQTLPEKRTVYYSTPLQGKGAGMFKHMIQCAGDVNYSEGSYNTDLLNNRLVSMNLILDDKGYFSVKEITQVTHQQVQALGTQPQQQKQQPNNMGFQPPAPPPEEDYL